MNKPNKKDYLRNLDYRESMLSTYTDYYSYTNDLEQYCEELEKALDIAFRLLGDGYGNDNPDFYNNKDLTGYKIDDFKRLILEGKYKNE